MDDKFYMKEALKRAKAAYKDGETPIGAVIVKDGKIIATGRNLREKRKNALCHGEIIAINRACKKLDSWRLVDCDLYVTLEPCAMCAGAIINARIRRVIYGASDYKAGSFGSLVDLSELPYNHKPQITSGVMEEECAALLSSFFKELRETKKKIKSLNEENNK
ncbi:MAG: tRNA adenosine(34) deaminase TadA [Clostridia bacterium]|nr:tRNA adenosine(34) deaminase TadA [Clostridia bacterium]MBQ7048482.1 tRNA adenosine(34) deaminase TadA [Clostridia bacterium]